MTQIYYHLYKLIDLAEKGSQIKQLEFIKFPLEEDAQVRNKNQQIVLQYKDIGEATTKKDFHEPTEKQFRLIGLQELNYNYATKQAYGGTSTVTT